MNVSKIFKAEFCKTKKSNGMTAFDSPATSMGLAHVFKNEYGPPDRAMQAFFTNSAYATRMGGKQR